MIKETCTTCGEEFRTYPSWVKLGRKSCSWKCRDQYGIKNNQWVGKDLSYKGVHRWLERNFGKANLCEKIDCEKKSNSFDWALLQGKKYERNRDNFWKLCRSCHKKYDITEKLRDKYKARTENRLRNNEGKFV